MKPKSLICIQCILCALLFLGAAALRRYSPHDFNRMQQQWLAWFEQQPKPEEPVRFAAANPMQP